MRKQVIWMVVFVLLATGLYAIARQKANSGKPKSAAAQPAAAPVISLMAVRMYAHKDKDHFDDNDHCIEYDQPGDEKSLWVEVDLSGDPQSDPMMNLALLYTRPGEPPRAEVLSSSCKRDGPTKTTCRAEFKETVKVRGKLHQEWHLGDQPDGMYSTTGMLGTAAAIKTSAGVQGAFPYLFRNPDHCDLPFSKPKFK
jgi:hypothetical protein